MSEVIDMEGLRFGRLTVIMRWGSAPDGKAMWLCECDCGKRKVIRGKDLRRGMTQSCGCYKRELTGKINFKHGATATPLYARWAQMHQRCSNPNRKDWAYFGGRGISVCKEWKEFEPFQQWAQANGFHEEFELDLIDMDGNYCPENCRWGTRKEISNNRHTNRFLTLGEETHTIREWATITGVKEDAIAARIGKLHWSVEKALTMQTRSMKKNIETLPKDGQR